MEDVKFVEVKMTEKRMHYKKYISNGDLPELNEHHCICCGVAEQNMEIFVFFGKINSDEETPYIIPENINKKAYTSLGASSNSYISPSGLSYPPNPIFKTGDLIQPHYNTRKRHQIFLCAECLYKLSQKISPDTIAKWVMEKV